MGIFSKDAIIKKWSGCRPLDLVCSPG